IAINQVTIDGVPNIELRAFNTTTFNGTTETVLDFPMTGGPAGPVNAIDINNPAFFGQPDKITGGDTVLIGNLTAPSLSGNLTIAYGPGKATVNAKINCNALTFAGNFGAASGSDTVTVHESLIGQISLVAGLPGSRGTSSLTLSSDTAAFVTISQPDAANNTVNITNKTNNPPTRPAPT